MPRKRRHRSAEEITELVHEFEESGLSQSEFADLWSMDRAEFGRWIRQIRRVDDGETRALVPVRVTAAPRRKRGSGLDLQLRSGVTIRVEPGFDEETLQRVVRAIERC